MKQQNLILKLQKQHKEGGYALVSSTGGKVYVFGQDFKKLYQEIDKKKIDDANKLVMYVPPMHVRHVLSAGASL